MGPLRLARWRVLVFAVMSWVVVLGATARVDGPVATWVHQSAIDQALRTSQWTFFWKMPGTFEFTIAVVALGVVAGWLNWRNALFVLLTGAMVGFDVVPKWLVGRIRPYKIPPCTSAEPFHLFPLWHGIWGLLHEKDLSFPSGHESSAWALAVAISVLYPRVSVIFFLLAAAVGVERVLENAHYCSDVVAAVPFATCACWIAWWLVQPRRPIRRARR